jgi:hypothetical protein
MSTCPSTWKNSTPIGQIFMKFDMRLFRKSVDKIQVSSKSDKNMVTLREDFLHLWHYHTEFFLEREMFQVKGEGKLKHILRLVNFPPPPPRIVPFMRYRKTLWSQRDRRQYGICVWHAELVNYAHACLCIPPPPLSQTHVHIQKYVRHVAFPWQQWFRECLSVTLYIHCLSCNMCHYLMTCILDLHWHYCEIFHWSHYFCTSLPYFQTVVTSYGFPKWTHVKHIHLLLCGWKKGNKKLVVKIKK